MTDNELYAAFWKAAGLTLASCVFVVGGCTVNSHYTDAKIAQSAIDKGADLTRIRCAMLIGGNQPTAPDVAMCMAGPKT